MGLQRHSKEPVADVISIFPSSPTYRKLLTFCTLPTRVNTIRHTQGSAVDGQSVRDVAQKIAAKRLCHRLDPKPSSPYDKYPSIPHLMATQGKVKM
jgi:hypothetical protein